MRLRAEGAVHQVEATHGAQIPAAKLLANPISGSPSWPTGQMGKGIRLSANERRSRANKELAFRCSAEITLRFPVRQVSTHFDQRS